MSIRLSPAAEFAIRGTAVLAEEFGRGPVPLAAICSRRDLPKDYLAKILGALAKQELVLAVRGKRGGYALARDPSQIPLLEIVEAVEGPLAVNLCQHDPPKCDEEDCPAREAWRQIQQFVRAKLAELTLADFVH